MNFRHTLIAGATAGVALLSLSACGSSAASNSAAAGQPTAAASAGADGTGTQGGAAGGRMPGATGRIAAKQDSSTLQVQNETDGQVAVTYSAKTAITAQVAAARKDITVGSCVSVTPASNGAASSGGSAQSSVVAGTVRISQPVDGDCTAGFGGAGGPGGGMPGGGMPSGMPTARPTDLPGGGSGMPTDAPSGFGGGGRMFGANGTVTAVTASGFTVKSSFPGSDGSTTNSTITVDGATTYTTTKSSDSSALKVGQCVVATGQTDNTGAVAATRLTVSAPVDGECSSGSGFGRPSGGQGGAA